MKYFRVKEKGKEKIIGSVCKNMVDFEEWVQESKNRYYKQFKNCGYKVRDFELKDAEFQNNDYVTIIKIIDTNIEL